MSEFLLLVLGVGKAFRLLKIHAVSSGKSLLKCRRRVQDFGLPDSEDKDSLLFQNRQMFTIQQRVLHQKIYIHFNELFLNFEVKNTRVYILSAHMFIAS